MTTELNGKLLADMTAAVARIDERTQNLPERLASVEAICTELRVSLANRAGLDVGRDEKVADLRRSVSRTAATRGLAAGAGATGVLAIAKAAWGWVTGQ